MTGDATRCDDPGAMGAPRVIRGGGEARRRALRATVVALTALALVFVQHAPALADDPLDSQLAEALRKKQDLERAVQTSRQNAERYKQAATQFQAAVNAANVRISDLASRQAAAQSESDVLKIDIEIKEEQLQLVAFQLTETKSFVESLQAQGAEQERQLARREEIYALHLRTTYRHAQVSPLEMLLSSRSLADFAGRVQAMVLVDRQDRQLAGEIRALRDKTAAQKIEVDLKQQEIAGLQKQIESQRATLAKHKAEYDALVRAMQASINEQADLRQGAATNRNSAVASQQRANAETSQLNQRLEQAEAAYAALAAELARRAGLGAFTGRLAMWPLSGPMTSPFGARWGGFHNGIDIAAPMYTPVRSAAAGQVVTAGRPYFAFGDTAIVVIVAHGSNFSTIYGHLDRVAAGVGARVNAGSTVGYVGMTGWTTGPHLHFMTVVDGRARDPIPYLP